MATAVCERISSMKIAGMALMSNPPIGGIVDLKICGKEFSCMDRTLG